MVGPLVSDPALRGSGVGRASVARSIGAGAGAGAAHWRSWVPFVTFLAGLMAVQQFGRDDCFGGVWRARIADDW